MSSGRRSPQGGAETSASRLTRRGILLIAAPWLFAATGAIAFTFADGTTAECVAAGRVVPESNAPPGHWIVQKGRIAITGQAGSGYQIIWNAQQLAKLPPEMHDFIFFHECAHARVPTQDEVKANCQGLKDMRAAGRAGFAVEAKLAAIYGPGSTYWEETRKCADGKPAP